ncbi:MAG: DUF4330 domain-containing protein [Peptococcaceae bacterium]|nr:DUF4330 domain-containing protein [Peptococcaceae bacterium]
MPFLNRKGKFLGLINPVDLAIVLIVLGLLGGAGYKFLDHRATAPVRTVTFEFVAPAVEPQVAALIHVGDLAFSPKGPAAVATQGIFAQPVKITRVRVGPYMARVSTTAGTRERNPDPYLKDVVIWAQGSTPVPGGSIDLAGEQVRAGTKFWLASRLWELYGTVERVRIE